MMPNRIAPGGSLRPVLEGSLTPDPVPLFNDRPAERLVDWNCAFELAPHAGSRVESPVDITRH
jgi:hypothetical protein